MSNNARKASKLAIRRAEAWKLYTSGMNQTEVANKLSTSQKTISRDIIFMLNEFKQERIADIEAFRASEISSITQLELAANNNIHTIEKYLQDKANGLDVKCSVVPIDLSRWFDVLVKLKNQKSKISGLDKETVKIESDVPIEVQLTIRGKSE